MDVSCLEEPLYELIIGNVRGARNPNNPDPNWVIVAASITKAQAQQEGNLKPLKVKKVTSRYSVTKEDLCRMQNEDKDLKPFAEKKKAAKRGEYEVKFEKYRGILYRIRHRSDGLGETEKQIMIPKNLRHRVMELAYDSMFGDFLGTTKTEDRIQTNFYWPKMHQDVASFCRSCDVCQKTVTKGSIPRAPLGEMPLIDLPFKRVAINLMEFITPASDKGHRYILTLVDYASKYAEAVPIKNIDTETVAEALLDLYSRVGVPEEVLSDFGT